VTWGFRARDWSIVTIATAAVWIAFAIGVLVLLFRMLPDV
jgi:hypothetical protein